MIKRFEVPEFQIKDEFVKSIIDNNIKGNH